MMSRCSRLFLGVGLVGPIFYFIVMTVLGLLWPGYSPVVNYMSELGGVESPFMLLMNVFGFMGIGITIVLFSFGLRGCLSKNIFSQLTFYTSFTAGIFMILVGFFPCDAGCVDVTLTGRLHTITSIPPSILLPAAAMISAVAFLKESFRHNVWIYIFFCLGAISMTSGAVSTLDSLQSYIGLIQRIGIGTSLFWMCLISLVLLSEEPKDFH